MQASGEKRALAGADASYQKAQWYKHNPAKGPRILLGPHSLLERPSACMKNGVLQIYAYLSLSHGMLQTPA